MVNRPLEDWGQVLGDTAVAGAILDRFLHHTEIIGLQGRSYCMYDRQQRGGSQPLQALTTETKVRYL
jgi:DNA replication protein DnaC